MHGANVCVDPVKQLCCKFSAARSTDVVSVYLTLWWAVVLIFDHSYETVTVEDKNQGNVNELKDWLMLLKMQTLHENAAKICHVSAALKHLSTQIKSRDVFLQSDPDWS